ncbi:MAG: TonB-dependent receptor, partial [Candidatus Aminicenantes bacterium]
MLFWSRNLHAIYNHFLKIGAFLFCVTLTLVCLCDAEAAHLDEEMLILRMYYKEKDLVVSATRHLKPISQVAENVTVVTAQEIEDMNAHTVAEVLNRLTGFFVSFSQDFGSTSLPRIQGSDEWHVLVLVDGVPWNFLSTGAAETNSIPVGIIERIEVIKGPASSAWGSSLGGVVNIITKSVGDTARPAVSIRASYGERNTQDYRAEASGLAGPAGYYLFAGRQESDGLRSSRYFDNDSFYSKWNLTVSDNVDVGLSIGYSEPHIKFGDFPSLDITSTG